MNPTRIAITLFCLAVAFGPVYTVPGYSARANLISELAAQNTRGAFIMAGAFVVLGAAIVFDGWRVFRSCMVPFMLFGAFMVLAGLFGHKPMTSDVPYSATVAGAHSLFATMAGIGISLAFVWQAWLASAMPGRLTAAALALVCLVLPLGMLNLPAYQGVIQRLMYALVFAWLWLYYPHRVDG